MTHVITKMNTLAANSTLSHDYTSLYLSDLQETVNVPALKTALTPYRTGILIKSATHFKSQHEYSNKSYSQMQVKVEFSYRFSI